MIDLNQFNGVLVMPIKFNLLRGGNGTDRVKGVLNQVKKDENGG